VFRVWRECYGVFGKRIRTLWEVAQKPYFARARFSLKYLVLAARWPVAFNHLILSRKVLPTDYRVAKFGCIRLWNQNTSHFCEQSAVFEAKGASELTRFSVNCTTATTMTIQARKNELKELLSWPQLFWAFFRVSGHKKYVAAKC
jgi:hypothetical protein